MKLRLVLLFVYSLLILSAENTNAQYRRKTKLEKEFYESGKIKKMTRTKTVQSVYIDPYTFFKKTMTHATEYYENGKVRTKMYRKTRIDKSSPGCYEVRVITTSFSEDGKKTHREINECDKHKITNEFYEKGKIIFIRINYFLT